MKKLIVVFLLVFNCCTTFNTKKETNTNINLNSLIGEWIYQHSMTNDSIVHLKTDIHFPVYKLVYKYSKDTINLNNSHFKINQIRKNNFFKNITINTLNENGKLIDIYYPIGRFLNDSTLLEVYSYGEKYKYDYFIEKVYEDSLIINDNKGYLFNNRNNFNIKHIYLKERQRQ